MGYQRRVHGSTPTRFSPRSSRPRRARSQPFSSATRSRSHPSWPSSTQPRSRPKSALLSGRLLTLRPRRQPARRPARPLRSSRLARRLSTLPWWPRSRVSAIFSQAVASFILVVASLPSIGLLLIDTTSRDLRSSVPYTIGFDAECGNYNWILSLSFPRRVVWKCALMRSVLCVAHGVNFFFFTDPQPLSWEKGWYK